MIADRAEVSPATVYNLFGTKGAILVKVYELDLIDFEQRVSEARSAAALERMFDWYDMRGLMGSALALGAVLGREPRTLRAFFEELNAQTEPGSVRQPAQKMRV